MLGAAGCWSIRRGSATELHALCRRPRRVLHRRRGDDRLRAHRHAVRLRAGRRRPDVMCLSKGITGGFLPMGATLASRAPLRGVLVGGPGPDVLPQLVLHRQPDRLRRRRSPTWRSGRASRCWIASARSPPTCATAAGLPRPRRDRGHPRSAGPSRRSNCGRRSPAISRSWRPASTASSFRAACCCVPIGNVVYVLPPYCISSDELDGIYDVIDDCLAALRNRSL